MFDEFETFIDQLGNLLQNQPGLAGQIGWGLLAVVAVWKIASAVGSGKMKLGEAGQKLEELLKNFQWRMENGNEKAIRTYNVEGDTVYSNEDGTFEIYDRYGNWHNVSDLLSRRERKRLAKLRKQVVKGLKATHKADSESYISAQVENFLSLPTKEDAKRIKGNLQQPAVKGVEVQYHFVNDLKQKPVQNVAPVQGTVQPAKNTGGIAGGSCLIGGDKVKLPEAPKKMDAPKPEQIKKMDQTDSPLRQVIDEASKFLAELRLEVPKPIVVEQKPVVQQASKIVVCCPKCRVTRAIVEKNGKIPECPECVIPGIGSKVLMTETTADPQEFLKTNPLLNGGMAFKNYSFDNDTRFQAITANVKPLLGSVKKQPSETIKDKQIVALFKELNKKDKKVVKKDEPKVVDANKIFANLQPVAAKIEAPKVEQKPVEAPKVVEPKKVESEYTVMCCPKCRIARAIKKKGDNTVITCKNGDCNDEKMVETTGNAEEFVLENGTKVTEYLKQSGKSYIRFRNYGSKDGKKFVAVLLPMKNTPIHNGVKMEVKKQLSESIVGFVKKGIAAKV